MPDGLKILGSQFTLQAIVDSPCDSRFYALLNQTAILKRPYDAQEGVKKTNEYGEVVMTYTDAPVINYALKIRIDRQRTRTSEGFKVEFQGGVVISDYLAFTCPGENICENDIIEIGERKYQVLLVDEMFARSNLHHLEIRMRRIDLL